MSRSTPLPSLALMFESAQYAVAFVDGMTQKDFAADAKTQAAVAMCLINIGEGAAQLSRRHPEVCAANPHIAWAEIVGLRNRIVNDYMSINFAAVWEMVQSSLPDLLNNLPSILGSLGYTPSTGEH